MAEPTPRWTMIGAAPLDVMTTGIAPYFSPFFCAGRESRRWGRGSASCLRPCALVW